MVYDTNGNPLVDEGENGQDAFAVAPFASTDEQSLVSATSGVIALFDALVTAYPAYVSKNTLTSGTFTNYEYVFSTGAYNSYASTAYTQNPQIAKPVVLVTAGIHGYERSGVMANYVFFKALCDGADALKYIREAVIFKTIPVVNPYGYDHDSRYNENSVDLNRNFNASWISQSAPYYSGTSAASEAQTKVVQNWISANTGASALLDIHNSEVVNEISMMFSIGSLDNVTTLKDRIRKTINHEITRWKIDRELPSTSIFFYTATSNNDHGMLSMYSRDKGIPSILAEFSWNVNSTGKHSATTIGVNSEALSAILLGICACVS